jgi:electron-transferring-flavoprotein dehydrogenase
MGFTARDRRSSSTARPADYPPPMVPGEFVAEPSAPAEERVEVGVVIVGGGPAGMACAIRLMQLLGSEPALTDSLGEVPVAVVEKARSVGSHLLSGAVMDPSAMQRLFADLPDAAWPTYGTVEREAVYLLSRRHALRLPRVPPPFRNRGNQVVSLAQLGRWLSERAQEAGVTVLPETAAHELLVKDGVVHGVRTGAKGRGRDGEELSNFEPGSELLARATVLAEGTQGHLALTAIEHFGLGSSDPQGWELGVKEVWEVGRPLERLIHTMGWPLRPAARYREFGGSFIYPMGEHRVSLGLVVGLDYRDATLSVHDLLQELKTHPLLRGMLDGGRRVAWGAKTIPAGGYWALPERLWAPGLALVGDCAGLVDVPHLKGIHLAMHAGMDAAESIFSALKDGSTEDLSAYQAAVRASPTWRALYRSRNMRQPFSKGFLVGGVLANLMELSGGRLPGGHWRTHADAEVGVFIGERDKRYPRPDGKLTFDKLGSVYLSGNRTRDDAPNHLRIQRRVPLAVGLMWQHMCPAQVYEVPAEQLERLRPAGAAAARELVDVHVTPSNCVQCGATTAKGGRLTPAEGGDGPGYELT